VRPVGYLPIRIYVGGEVRRPGHYTLRGLEMLSEEGLQQDQQVSQSLKPTDLSTNFSPAQPSQPLTKSSDTSKQAFPTVFDAICAAQGISPFSDLARVEVTRKQPFSAGGGRIRTNLNFICPITNGDESQNIRLFDGDAVSVGRRSTVVLRDQVIRDG